MALNLTSNSLALRAGGQTVGRSTDRTDPTRRSNSIQPGPDRLFENKVALTPTRSNFEDASEVKLSTAAQASIKGTERATRTLSNATTFVSLAQDGVSKIKELLSQARQKIDAVKSEVNQPRRQLLAEESAALLEEVDTIVAESELNGESVFNSGSRSFSFDLNSAPPTGDSTYVFNVSDFAVSRASLGLSGIDASVIEADSTAATDAISDAEARLSTTQASIEKSKQTLNTVAKEFGITSAQNVTGERRINERQATELADQIASSIQESVVDPANTQNLDAERVGALIGEDDEEKSKASITLKKQNERAAEVRTE